MFLAYTEKFFLRKCGAYFPYPLGPMGASRATPLSINILNVAVNEVKCNSLGHFAASSLTKFMVRAGFVSFVIGYR